MGIQKPITLDRLVRWIITSLVILGLFWITKRLSSVLIPFVLALFFAYYINPLVLFFQEKLKFKKRGLSIFSALFTITLFFTGLWLLISPLLNKEIKRASVLIQRFYSENISDYDHLPEVVTDFTEKYVQNQNFKELFSSLDLATIADNIANQFSSILGGSINILLSILGLFIILLYTVFILTDYEKIRYGWPGLIPIKYRRQSVELVKGFQEGLDSYFRAQAIVALIVGILFSIGFYIIGLPLAIFLGLFVGLLNMIPYLQILGFIPALFCILLNTMETGDNFWGVTLLTALVFAVVQLIQESILIPKIMGKVTGLKPAVIMLSLSIWGSLLGMLGMLIALPATTLILSYYKAFIVKDESKFYEENINE
mgnify:CR=1 FL=1